jgi:hypothetical protein
LPASNLQLVRSEVFAAATVLQTAATCSRWFLTRGFFYPEDEGDTFLRNVGSHKIYTEPYGILQSSTCSRFLFFRLSFFFLIPELLRRRNNFYR